MNDKRKPYALALSALLTAVALAGCMNSGNRTNESEANQSATQTPYVATQPSEVTSPAPSAGDGGQPASESGGNGSDSAAQTQAYDWQGNATAVEERMNQFSEIASSRIVVCDTTALVGVEFDPQYKGEMTERIRQMIAGVVMSYDARVQTVAATADPEDVKKIADMSDRMREGGDQSQIKTEVDSIMRNTSTLS